MAAGNLAGFVGAAVVGVVHEIGARKRVDRQVDAIQVRRQVVVRNVELGIDYAGAGDVVYIAGKGHENYQILGNQRIDFDDRVVAIAALEDRRKRELASSKD